ncbi:hypothetical protein C4544_07205 [candidate division WS5 bacterium]|uniref:Uncharacterized protein n=1 Tax=candidate division WS5 bacterium TaxID=2093353 RepID=A0A419DAG5_9BACT|nr:MAG: hypothetical protein C4544_07205 [candidate division WS5 bacterium]
MEIEKEITEIKNRNKKVEADKAWETSLFRKVLITFFTYIITAIVFYFIGVENYLLSAIIPTTGYFVSIQSLPFIKNWWIDKYYNERS